MTTEQKQTTTAIAAPRSAPFLPIGGLQIDSFDSLQRFARAMAETGHYGGDVRRAAAEIMLRVQAGAELGIPPIASITNISIINGVPSQGAHLIRYRCEQQGYDIAVKEHDAKACTVVVSRNGKVLGESRYTVEDAQRADLFGKKSRNWERHPMNMVYARAVSNAARFYCPSAFFGSVYSTEEMRDEMGISVDGVEVIERASPETERRFEAARAISAEARIVEVESDETKTMPDDDAGADETSAAYGARDVVDATAAAIADAIVIAKAATSEQEICAAWERAQNAAPEAARETVAAIFDATLSRFLRRPVSSETAAILQAAREAGLLPQPTKSETPT